MISRKLKAVGYWLKDNWGSLLVCAVSLGFLTLFGCIITQSVRDGRANERSRRNYCGTVTARYRYDATKGHSAEAHVVYHCPDVNRYIDVEVSNNTYANAVEGTKICFTLTDRDLKR